MSQRLPVIPRVVAGVSVVDNAVIALEDAISELPELIELETDHYFSDELYARALHIPAGTVLTGKVHKRDHLNFLMKGEIKVMTDEGVKHLVAPAIIPSKKGIKRAGFAITDTLWVTVHHCDKTSVEEAEKELVEPNRPSIDAAIEKHRLEKMT